MLSMSCSLHTAAHTLEVAVRLDTLMLSVLRNVRQQKRSVTFAYIIIAHNKMRPRAVDVAPLIQQISRRGMVIEHNNSVSTVLKRIDGAVDLSPVTVCPPWPELRRLV